MPKSWGIIHYSVAALGLAALLAIGWLTDSTRTRAKKGPLATAVKRDESVERASDRAENPGQTVAGQAGTLVGSLTGATDDRPKLAPALAAFAVSPPKAVAHFEGIPSPGRRILL